MATRRRTVVACSCPPCSGKPPAGGAGDLPAKPRYAGGFVIGFCDNHAELVKPEDAPNLIWNPKAIPAATISQ